MKKSFVVAMAILGLLCACSMVSKGLLKPSGNSQNQSRITMERNERPTLQVEKAINALRIGRAEVSRTAQITLELQNTSKERLRIWKDSNSWGAACWRVLLIRAGHVEAFFQNPDQDFTKNAPTFSEIAAGGRFEQKLDLNGGNWCGFGRCSIYNERGVGGKLFSFEANETVIVIYDVPLTQETRDNGVWYGMIATTANVQ
jgi:hypothetical protein